jgi:Tfp pilus assembly protein PilN
MIRINLIQKKQASYVSGGQKSGGAGLGFLQTLSSGGSAGLVTILKSIGIPLVLCVAANYGYGYYIQQKTSEMSAEMTTLNSEKDRINKELQKIKGFESVKVELERNELILRAKIETIEKLIRGRDFTVKSLITLAQSMPRDMWMTEIKANETTFDLKGSTTDTGLLSEFMTRLGQSIYFKDVSLKTAVSTSDQKQSNFELGARRE